MNLPGLSIKRPVTIMMMIMVVVMIGTVSLSKLEMDLLPDLSMPIAVATARYGGAGPKEIESLITRPFEGVLSTVSNVESIETMSYNEYAIAILYFNNGTDMNFASLEMREKLDLVKPMLPTGVSDIMVMRIDPNEFHATMEIGVSSDLALSDLTRLIDEQMVNKLERLDGVASVSLTGGIDQEIHVNLAEDRISLYGLNATLVSQILRAENLDLPAGNIEATGRTVFIRTKGKFTSLEEIKKLSIPTLTGGNVRLEEIADVSIQNKERTNLSYINGKPSLSLSVLKQTNANTVGVCDAIRKALKQLQKQYPQVNFHVVYDGSRYINQAIQTVSDSALQGAVLAVLVLYLFLRSIRATLIVALSIPVSIIATFVLMFFAGIKLNLLSLGGLALGVGMLVDNSIVVLENIYRHRLEGKSIKEAAEQGTREVMLAISASTLTTVVVFIPIVFIEGITGKIFKEMALTITFSLLSSLLIAITFVPMVASRIFKLEYQGKTKRRHLLNRFMNAWDHFYQRFCGAYERLLKHCLSKKAITMTLAFVMLAASSVSVFLIGYEYFPSMDEGYVTLEVSLPKGSSLSETHAIAMEVQSRLNDVPEVKSVVMNLGTGGFALDRTTTENAVITAGIGKVSQRKRSIQAVSSDILKRMSDIPGASIRIANDSNLMGFKLGTSTLEIRLYGDDNEKLKTLSEAIGNLVSKVDGVRGLENSAEEETEEAVIHINRTKAALYQLSTAQIADSVITAVNGSVATRYQYRGSQIDVKVSSFHKKADSIEALKSVVLKSALGVSIPLSEVAEIKLEKTPATLKRTDQKRCVTITAGTNGKALNQITHDIEKAIEAYGLPVGYTYAFGGQQQELVKSFDDLFMTLILAAFIVYMLMAAQFESLIYPLIIMMTVPLSLTGGLISLLITGKTLSIPSFIGIIILVGIVVDNAIVLIDTIIRMRKSGLSIEEAVLKAGPQRLRPILMTTLTTVLGMIPMAIGGGEGSEIQSPLAIVVIGGLSISTLITLLIIPSVYLGLNRLFSNNKKRPQDAASPSQSLS